MNIIDEGKLRDAWESLDLLWDDFENLRQSGMSTSSFIHTEEVERFIHGWQVSPHTISIDDESIFKLNILIIKIVIFECRKYIDTLVQSFSEKSKHSF